MIKSFRKNFWSLLTILVSISLFYVFYKEHNVNYLFATVCSVVVHICVAFRTDVSDPIKIKLVSYQIWNNNKWCQRYSIEKYQTVESFYMNIKFRTTIEWNTPDNYSDLTFYYTDKTEAMKEIQNILKEIKKKLTFTQDVKDIHMVEEIVVAEEIKKIEI